MDKSNQPTGYYVKVTTHPNNAKGRWIAREVNAEFKNVIIDTDDYAKLVRNIQLIVNSGDQKFPSCKAGNLNEFKSPAGDYMYISYSARKSVDIPDVALTLTPVRKYNF